MRVNYLTKVPTVSIGELASGETFICKRSKSSEMGAYMKIGSCVHLYSKTLKSYAVNLSTGQIREFRCDHKVEPVEAEVQIP